MLRAFTARFPTLASGITGYGVMAIGDGLVQTTVEASVGDFDTVRNVTSASFQGAAGMFMGRWWRFLDALIPGTTITKLALNQVALSCTLTPSFLIWSGTVEAPLHGVAVDWAQLGDRLRSELPTLLPTSFCFWLPFNSINFMVVPPHLRVAFISSVSVAWGGYLSFVSHGRRVGGEHTEQIDGSST